MRKGVRRVLGLDPGSKANCGWAVVEGDADHAKVLQAGVCVPNGFTIGTLLTRVHQDMGDTLAAFAFEVEAGQFRNAATALNRVIGKWLGVLELSMTYGHLPRHEVWTQQWQSAYVGNLRTPAHVTDPITGEKRKLLDAEKKAAKGTREEAYRMHAVEHLGLDPSLPADAAAAAWVARYVLDER